MMNTKSKPMPSFSSDADAEQFVETADLSEYDLSGFKPMRFELDRNGQDDGYRAMAADTAREVEASEWCNALLVDVRDADM